MTLKLKRIPPA